MKTFLIYMALFITGVVLFGVWANARDLPCFILGPAEGQAEDISCRTVRGTPKKIRDQFLGPTPRVPGTDKQLKNPKYIPALKWNPPVIEDGIETPGFWTIDRAEYDRITQTIKDRLKEKAQKRARKREGRNKRMLGLQVCQNINQGQTVGCVEKLAKAVLIMEGVVPEDEEPVDQGLWEEVKAFFGVKDGE